MVGCGKKFEIGEMVVVWMPEDQRKHFDPRESPGPHFLKKTPGEPVGHLECKWRTCGEYPGWLPLCVPCAMKKGVIW